MGGVHEMDALEAHFPGHTLTAPITTMPSLHTSLLQGSWQRLATRGSAGPPSAATGGPWLLRAAPGCCALLRGTRDPRLQPHTPPCNFDPRTNVDFILTFTPRGPSSQKGSTSPFGRGCWREGRAADRLNLLVGEEAQMAWDVLMGPGKDGVDGCVAVRACSAALVP